MSQKLAAQFSLLTKPQQSRFRLFLQSPYFNSNGKMLQLHDKLCEGVKEKKALNDSLYYPDVYDDLKLRRIFSDFGKLLSLFLAVEDIGKETLADTEATLKACLKAGEHKLFNQQLQASVKKWELETIQDSQYHYHGFKLAEWGYALASKTQNREASSNLSETLRQLDVFHAGTKLKYICEQVNRANVLNEPYDKDEARHALTYLDKLGPIPAILVYHHILLTLLEPEALAHYDTLKAILPQHEKGFEATEVRDLYGFAQNYCIKKINGGNTNFLEELFQLYQQLLHNGAILYNGELSAPDYKNIVFVGLRLDKHAWVREFLENYKGLLPANHQREAYVYNLAYYHYFRKEYQETLALLNTVRFRDVYYYLDSRSLLLKTFYELDEIDPLYSLMESASAYLRRNKLISAYQKQIYQKLFRYVKKLVGLQSKGKKAAMEVLAKLEKETTIADKVWLRNKLQELL